MNYNFVIAMLFLFLPLSSAHAHEGPDPVMHWNFTASAVKQSKLAARLGPDAMVEGELEAVQSGKFQSLKFDGKDAIVVAKDFVDLKSELMPKEALTVSALVSIEEGKLWGGIVGVIQDNGGEEAGWVVGYNQKHFYFGLASEGADDGNGMMTYLNSKVRYEPGKIYHVVAVYDGKRMQLIVNGQIEGETDAQSGKILYPKHAPFTIGAYRDSNENFPHVGRIADIAIYDLAAKPQWAAKEFEHYRALTELPAEGVKPVELGFSVKPYLQYVTRNSITVMWETTKKSSGKVQYGADEKVATTIESDNRFIHEVKISDLEPETQYFYKVISTDDAGASIENELRTFQTASKPDSPFAFAIISDTQGNPAVSGKMAEYAWAHRPNFLLHPGDLVSTGSNDSHWKDHFFASMEPLISRVAFFPVLGNHEQNAANYYNYMSLPDPEYYYTFDYGNAQFFMLDTNKNVGPETEQFKWLDKELSASKATWKIVCHHHPPYSSDENDYGNLWKSNKSTRGDLRVRKLTKLYDKHQVDLVWCGHIHSYERTWQIRGDKVVDAGGVQYMITGGGGGGLERAGPFKPAFQNNVRRGHHYCMVAINGGTLEFKAFDLEDRLFDYQKIEKK